VLVVSLCLYVFIGFVCVLDPFVSYVLRSLVRCVVRYVLLSVVVCYLCVYGFRYLFL